MLKSLIDLQHSKTFDRFATLAMLSQIVLLMAALHCDLMNEETSADMTMGTVEKGDCLEIYKASIIGKG